MFRRSSTLAAQISRPFTLKDSLPAHASCCITGADLVELSLLGGAIRMDACGLPPPLRICYLGDKMKRWFYTRAERQIILTQEAILASLSDLQTAVAKIGSDITAAIADIKALSTAQPGGINPADLDPIVAALTASSASLEAVLPPAAPAP